MTEIDYWKLIGASKQEAKGDLDRQVDLLQRTLEQQSEQEIRDFDRLLHEQMAKSYSRDLWAAAYIINGGCSDDGFDYFRAWLIAQGQEIFHAALANPESLVDVAQPDVELESLLYVAPKAFEAKTKNKFPYPKRPQPELTGDEWEEDELALQKKFPKLFAKFWGSSPEQSGSNQGGTAAQGIELLKRLIGGRQKGAPGAEALYMQAVMEALDDTPEQLAKSAALLTQAADLGHAGAQYLLGACFQDGRGVTQDYVEAAKRFRQAAENGNADACGGLGAIYYEGLGIELDYDEAFKWYQKGADGGAADAEFGLGLLYADGLGVKQDSQESFKWFHRAAQNGHERAALNLGLYYLHGTGVEPDASEAFKWFEQAADAGSAQARYNLGVLYENGRGVEQDCSKAAEMYQMAADLGSGQAMSNLGMLYANGKGVAQDYSKAAGLYRQAADAGNLVALSNLAVLYQHGRGVPQNQSEAVQLYRQAAEAGIPVAQYNMGTMYHRGIGVEKDDNEAVRWYQLAAAQNHPQAMNNLGDAYENGYGVEKDYAKAFEWYRKAADRGVSVSQYSLGIFYRDGLGVNQDYLEAEKWFMAAVNNGFEKAGSELESLYQAGHVKRPSAASSQSKVSESGSATKSPQPAEQKVVSAQVAARRALCLRALVRRGEIEVGLWAASEKPYTPHKLDLEKLKAEARQINEWLKDEELWLAASEKEKKAFNLAPGSWPQQLFKDAAWRAEALGVIGWALGLEDRIFPYDAQLDSSSFVTRFQILSPSKQFIGGAKLKEEKEILAAREIAEAWLWRARTTQIQKEPDKYPPPPGWTFEKIIRAAAEHWEKEGLFKAVRGDYPARGKAYAELTENEWQELRSIATERLYGLNWLCKYSDNWDLVPTGT